MLSINIDEGKTTTSANQCLSSTNDRRGEDVGTVGQVVGAVELYSAVLVHSPDCDCRPNKDTYVHYTNTHGL